jgi:1-acyl-sn-glycerol-3-phosphate acyltransferase
MDMLGVIWVHRGQPDRRAISAALEAFNQGRRIIIAPEGRESVSGALEEGTEGAAFLALTTGVPVVPITITGSEFRLIENNLKKFRRMSVTLRVGKPFVLSQHASSKDALEEGTRIIMETLACQLPPKYRGVYGYVGD